MANDDKKDEREQAQGGSGAGPGAAADGDAGREPGGAAGEVPAGMGPFERARAERFETSATTDDPDRSDPVRGDGEPAAPTAGAASEHRGGGGGGGRGFLAGILGSLLVLALIAAAGYVTRDRWAPPVAGMLAQYQPQQPARGDEQMRVAESINTLKTETADVRSQLAASGNRLSSLQEELDSLRQEVEQVAADAAAGTTPPDTPPGQAGSGEGEAPQAAMAMPQPAQPDLSQPLEEIDQRLAELEMGGERLNAVEQQLNTIQSSLSQVRSAVDATGEQARRPAATVLAVNQLAEALGRSDGYAQQLETVRAIAGDDPDLTEPIGTLEQWAKSGVATFGELRARFPEMSRDVARSDYQREGDGWLDSVTNRLTSLVTVRKVGDTALAAGGVDAALAEAESALQNGDLAGAVKAIEGLQGQAAEAAASWLKPAQDRLAAEQALADLRMAAIAQLNAARG